jgi:hypothetical protein
MPPTLEPEVVKSVQEEKTVKRRRAQVRYKIRGLPPAVHRELDERLAARNYRSLDELSEWLEKEHGKSISPSSLAYYFRHELDPMLQAVKIATAQAAEIVRMTGDGDDEMSLALFRLTQTAIFDLLVQVNKTRHLVALIPAAQQRSTALLNSPERKRLEDGAAPGPEVPAEETEASAKYPTKVELAAVTALGKIVATINKAQIEWKKWRDQAREKLQEKVAATSARVSEMAREGGLSPEVEDSIRAALTEIKL